ncbi:5'-methylthioadenosine/S-adenosylhomocysteine nucleosidase [Haploplasma axanthum]|uniref:adenosylhomocysteine nucleosidase n=1 Tax=Haploplasma axanthum TaxID=29552 RepID=A0A449BCW1_HAPAX|nr:5'-methylthioadenosine/S-adenosylhomocysteine nucleosidase [Haploplasma axanthum]VEU80262.1 5'-methylthioadenosine/S-adenosylhomocysteine nucleosidase [Haploplasma axanthum]
MRLYVLAMDDEAKDLLPFFELVQTIPYKLYKNKNNLLAITMIGKVNASFVLSTVLATYKVTEVVNLGFSGANGDFNIGDIYIIEEARYHDVDVTMFGYEHGQVPKMPASYFSDQNLVSRFDYPKTKIYTGDCFMTTMKEGNYLVDMEVTALFQVAYRTMIPIISIKVISDVIGREKHLDDYATFEKTGSSKILEIYRRIEKL